MPLADNILGTNADGSKNDEYCIYCYKDGNFTGNFSMEEMVEYCSIIVQIAFLTLFSIEYCAQENKCVTLEHHNI